MPVTVMMRATRCSTHRRRWRSIPPGNIFIVDTENHVIRLIDAQTWIVTTIAGNGEAGPGAMAAWRSGTGTPHGAVVGPDGAVYVGDSENHRVRKLVQRR